MDTQVKLAETPDELAQVWQGRHRIYVEECEYAPASGDGLLRDAFDGLPRTANVIVVRAGRVLAGARMVEGLGEPLPTDPWFDFSPYLPPEPTRIAAGGFFFADPSLRGSRWIVQLIRFALRWDLQRGARLTVAVAAPRSRRLLEAFGFRLVAPPYAHPESGLPCVPLLLDLSRRSEERSAAGCAQAVWS
jgi:N-acyl-L-homoserine lactone synthetase